MARKFHRNLSHFRRKVHLEVIWMRKIHLNLRLSLRNKLPFFYFLVCYFISCFMVFHFWKTSKSYITSSMQMQTTKKVEQSTFDFSFMETWDCILLKLIFHKFDLLFYLPTWYHLSTSYGFKWTVHFVEKTHYHIKNELLNDFILI